MNRARGETVAVLVTLLGIAPSTAVAEISGALVSRADAISPSGGLAPAGEVIDPKPPSRCGEAADARLVTLSEKLRAQQWALTDKLLAQQARLRSLLYARTRDHTAIWQAHRNVQLIQDQMLAFTLEALDRLETVCADHGIEQSDTEPSQAPR